MSSTHEAGITVSKTDDFGEWYQQIITKCELIDYYDISGCYVLLPNAYFIWETIQKYLDREFKDRDVKNVYFPMFITKRNLEMEKDHIEGFSPEVAWVTKTGNTDLTQYKYDEDGNVVSRDESNHIAVRPTSECAIYPIIKNHIQSYMDLPLKYNQWCSVVRWEFKDPTPFIRSREFLWQEGHTCHKSYESAIEEVNDILDLYKQCYSDVLAIPTIRGHKTEKEKFCGAEITSTIEGYIPGANRAIQCATSHCLGQNFSKLFNIIYDDENSKNQHVWQNSWGFTTRSIGVMLMTHGDNKGMIYPPMVAPIQIVIIPIIFKDSKESVMNYINEVYEKLQQRFRVKVDTSNHKPGWKQNYWEVMGTPIRLEIGPHDVRNQTIRAVRRDTFEKVDVSITGNLTSDIYDILDSIHDNLYNRALQQLNESINRVQTWDEFIISTSQHNICLVPFCNETSCEEKIKEESGAKSLCIPTDRDYVIDVMDKRCIRCDKAAATHCLFGRSY
jgi:prolyl-tRNA synthetase